MFQISIYYFQGENKKQTFKFSWAFKIHLSHLKAKLIQFQLVIHQFFFLFTQLSKTLQANSNAQFQLVPIIFADTHGEKSPTSSAFQLFYNKFQLNFSTDASNASLADNKL